MRPLTYAIIEDIPDVATRLQHEMQRYAHWHCAGMATSVSQARQLIATERPALIFCDWDLIGGSGFEVLQHAAGLAAYHPFVVFNTGFQSDHPEIAEALVNEYRPDAFINKPYWKKLTEQLPTLLLQAAHKYEQQAQSANHAWWLHAADGRRHPVLAPDIICIVQDPAHPRHKLIYTLAHQQGLACTLTWPEAEERMRAAGVDYFVANKRQAIITRPFLLQTEGCYIYLRHLPFKIELVKERQKPFEEWLLGKKS